MDGFTIEYWCCQHIWRNLFSQGQYDVCSVLTASLSFPPLPRFALPLPLASVTHFYNITIFLNWSCDQLYFFFIEISVLEKEKLIERKRGGALRPNIGEALAKRNLCELNFYKSKLQFWFWILLEGIEYYLRLQYDGYWDLEVHPDLHSPQEGRQWCGLNFLPSGQFEPNLSRFSYFFVSTDIYDIYLLKIDRKCQTSNVYLCRYP